MLRKYLFGAVVVLLLLAGAGALALSAGLFPEDEPADQEVAADEQTADDRAADVLRQFQDEVDFPVYAPYYLGDLEPSVHHLTGPEGAPIGIHLGLIDPDDEEKRVLLDQSSSAPGTVAPPPTLEEEEQVEIQGSEALRQVGRADDRRVVQLIWEMDDEHLVLAAFQTDVDEAQRIAESVQPIDAAGSVDEADTADERLPEENEVVNEADDDDRAAEVMRELQGEVDFPIHAPYYLHGLEPENHVVSGPDTSPVVVLWLSDPDQSSGGQHVELHQSVDAPAEIHPSEAGTDAETRQVDVQGHEGELHTWESPDGVRAMLYWETDEMQFTVTTSQIEEEAVLAIAESIKPID